MTFCETCDARPVKARGECGTCGEYRRRTGNPRPVELEAALQTRADLERHAAQIDQRYTALIGRVVA